MSTSWRDEDEEFRLAGVKGGLKAKPRFSFNEVRVLLDAVKRNRYIILRKFNQGVSAEAKKQTWAEITDQINGLGENHREVRQIMKKWADLKCDGKRRIVALRGPNGTSLRKKKLGPVEKMVHKILMMSPGGDGDSDLDVGEDEDFSKFYGKGPSPSPSGFSYSHLRLSDNSHSLPGGASLEFSPLSSPEKEVGGDQFQSSSDFDLDLPEDGDDARLRAKPVYTYSRNSQNSNNTSSKPPPEPSSVASTSSGFPPVSESDATPSSAAPPPPQSSLPPPPPPASPSSSVSFAATDSNSHPKPSSSSAPPPPPQPSTLVSSSAAVPVTSAPTNSLQPPPSSAPTPSRPSTSGSNQSDPLPAGGASQLAPDHVAQLASQSVQQQRAGRMLLTSVSQSLELLAQSVQLLVESQQEFVQESLLLQRETLDILKDFSNTALTMLRDKSSSVQAATRHHPASHY
ncbi:uncharacterized protein ACBR49_003653 isoform 2-T2 [Aulostomus maculatus]